MAKSKKKEFVIQAKIDVLVGIRITADSLQEAVTASQDYTSEDFVTISGEHFDSEIRVTGVYEA